MSKAIELKVNAATEAEIISHFRICDASFHTPLSERVQIEEYARKLLAKSIRFEAWHGNLLVGLVAAYCDVAQGASAFISNVSVLPEWTGNGIASRLTSMCIVHAKSLGMTAIGLEVDAANRSAVKMYQKQGFSFVGPETSVRHMMFDIK